MELDFVVVVAHILRSPVEAHENVPFELGWPLCLRPCLVEGSMGLAHSILAVFGCRRNLIHIGTVCAVGPLAFRHAELPVVTEVLKRLPAMQEATGAARAAVGGKGRESSDFAA